MDDDVFNPYGAAGGVDLLDQAEFARNPEKRCPVVLCLDTSGSMQGMPIQEINDGLVKLAEAWQGDSLASKRVEVAIVTFGGGVGVLDLKAGNGEQAGLDPEAAFVTADRLVVPILAAGGDTPMGEAVRIAVRLLNGRKGMYKSAGIDYYRPQLFLFTDGQPTDIDWESGAQALRDEEQRKGVSVWPFGVEGADFSMLAHFGLNRRPVRIPKKAAEFREFFEWLSKSVSAVANSGESAQQVAAPELASSWAVIDI